MTLNEPASPSGTDVSAHASGQQRFGRLLAADGRVRATADSRRVAVAFIGLLALTAVTLNVGVYRSVRMRDDQDRWERLQVDAADRVGRLRDALTDYQREVQGVGLTLAPDTDASLTATLARTAQLFGWRRASIMNARGQTQAGLPGPGFPVPEADLVERVIETGKPALIRLAGSAIEPDWLLAIAPTAFAHRDPVALIVWSTIDNHMGSAISSGGRRAGVVSHLAFPEVGAAQAAARSANRGAQKSVVHDGRQQSWVVTYSIPELGAEFVTSAPPAVLGSSIDPGFKGLVVFDVAIALLVVASLFFWRRQYQVGLARRELEVTRRHARRTQAVFDSAFDAILTVGADGRVRSANRAAEGIMERGQAELEGVSFASLIKLEGAEATGLDVVSGRVSRGVVLRGDGKAAPVEVSVAETGDGIERLYTVVSRDISRQIEAEQKIRESAQGLEHSNRRLAELNAQLEEGSRLKSEFLANTSHELRTPLNGMIGFLQLVLDGMCTSPEEEREFLRQALECSRHLLGLINDVLDLAKIEAGKLSLDLEPIDPRTLLNDVYSVTHIQAVPKGLTLSFECLDGPTTAARADFRKAKQVIINLVGNAIKFTPSGAVTVRATEHAELGYWLFEVIDTGIGIPPDRQAQVFEKFIQADGSTTRTYGGTGLGLAISRSLVELMGGIIGVESEGEGKGTRMYFSLPVWRPEDESPALEGHVDEQIAGPAGGPLVLVVEDDAAFRHFVATMLHKHGYRTVEARHAEGAWVLARRLRPAIVVLDYALSCAEGASLRTGMDLAERMTQDDRTRHIPLIFVTGFDGEVLRRLKRNAFARGLEHLSKPIDASVLMARIEQMLGAIHDRPVRILMADDDPSIVAYVRKVLPEARFHIEVANNGDECLHILRVQPRGFDLLLLDLMMPGVSGYDVLRELAISGDHSDLPVLILTNFPEARTDEERRLLEQGAILDVLPKTSLHDHPMILPHIIDWHLQVRHQPTPETERPAADPAYEPKWEEAA